MTKSRSNAVAPAAKGQLVVGTGTDASTTLAVASTAGYLLSVDSAEATGLKWAAPAGGGKVLQVISAETTTKVSNSTTTLADTTLTATITPSAASSKILVLVTHNSNYRSNGNQNNALRIVLLRTSTIIARTGGINWIWPGATPVVESITGSVSFNYLDSPNTTSATTYKTQFANINNSAAVSVQETFGGSWDSTSYITLLEIGA